MEKSRLWKKTEGKLELMTGMLGICLIMLMVCVHIQLMLFSIAGLYMEDALAASNLASALVDISEYGASHTLWIADPAESYQVYQEALKANLQLDENWECARRELISGRVEILRYIIYNVRGQDITIHCFGSEGEYSREETGGLGSVRTPDGTLVESTTVYSRIGFPVEGILGVEVYARKDNSADIVTEAW